MPTDPEIEKGWAHRGRNLDGGLNLFNVIISMFVKPVSHADCSLFNTTIILAALLCQVVYHRAFLSDVGIST